MLAETQDFPDYHYVDNSSERLHDLKTLLMGALAGAVAGTLIATLYTVKGTRTRRKVSEKSKEFATSVQQKALDINEGVKEKVSNITETVTNKYDATKKTLTKVFRENPQPDVSSFNSAYSADLDQNVKISKAKVLLAVLGASTAGAIVWSFTTEKGNNTRTQIASSTKNMAANIKVKAPKIMETLKEVYKDAKEGVEELMEKEKLKTYSSTSSTLYGNTTV